MGLMSQESVVQIVDGAGARSACRAVTVDFFFSVLIEAGGRQDGRPSATPGPGIRLLGIFAGSGLGI